MPNLPALEILLMKENAFKDKAQFSKLRFPKLRNLNVSTCPAAEELGGAAKIELILLLEEIEFKKLNKEDVTKEDFEEAKKTKLERIERKKQE